MGLDESHVKSAGEKAKGNASVGWGISCKAQHVRKAFFCAFGNLHGSLADMGQEDGYRHQKNNGRGKQEQRCRKPPGSKGPMPAAMNPDAVWACLSENTGRRQLMMMPKDAAAVPEGKRIPIASVSRKAECVTALMARPASMRNMPLKSTKRGDLRTDRKPKTGCISPKNSCPKAIMKLTVA